ncbi:class II histocompatibility antigen, B-L beta chain-like [Apteryx mantelli]|uniref:Class II histocompatibility antigen, B-L beta chain-like n=1 Tax=Apteryx mantelli TaxID=2696672 RepID=A0ABM4FYC3_9AVES
MGTGHVWGAGRCCAGAALAVLAVLGARRAHGKETTGYFLEMGKSECQYLNGTERVRFLVRYIHNRQQFVHFDSEVGVFVADSPLGEPDAKYWNSQPEVLAHAQNALDKFCRCSYEVAQADHVVGRTVQPKVLVSPMQSGSLPQKDRLLCYVTGFYPPEIEVKWFKNGREETERVVATDVIQNGDWTYQELVMLESMPQSGDTYTCQVEHASLQQPLTQHWGAQSDTARSKMLTGVGGLVLGLIFLALGLVLYLRNKKGRAVAQPAGLLN